MRSCKKLVRNINKVVKKFYQTVGSGKKVVRNRKKIERQFQKHVRK